MSPLQNEVNHLTRLIHNVVMLAGGEDYHDFFVTFQNEEEDSHRLEGPKAPLSVALMDGNSIAINLFDHSLFNLHFLLKYPCSRCAGDGWLCPDSNTFGHCGRGVQTISGIAVFSCMLLRTGSVVLRRFLIVLSIREVSY